MAGLLRWLPTKSWMKWTGQSVIFPFYHGVYESTPDFLKSLYAVLTPQQFEQHLDELLRYYQPLSPDELMAFLGEGKRRNTPGFFLSFDDGLCSCCDIIAPILLRKGIPAAFYVNTDFVDNKDLFYRYKNALLLNTWYSKSSNALDARLSEIMGCRKDELKERMLSLSFNQEQTRNALADAMDFSFTAYLQKEKPYMNWEELKDLENKGFVIGSHGTNHIAYADLTADERRQTTRQSFDILEEQLNMKYRSFTFPFTDDKVPSPFFSWLPNELNLDWSFGTAGLKNDPAPKHLQRIPDGTRKL